jgi:hypothetical protein
VIKRAKSGASELKSLGNLLLCLFSICKMEIIKTAHLALAFLKGLNELLYTKMLRIMPDTQ